jgi:rhodanese-related sulfurtransferase
MIFEQIVTGCRREATSNCVSTRSRPTRRIFAYCEFGRVSTLAAATPREMGFQHAVALDGGMKAWREAGYPVKSRQEA